MDEEERDEYGRDRPHLPMLEEQRARAAAFIQLASTRANVAHGRGIWRLHKIDSDDDRAEWTKAAPRPDPEPC